MQNYYGPWDEEDERDEETLLALAEELPVLSAPQVCTTRRWDERAPQAQR